MFLFFQERNGDFLAIDTDTDHFGRGQFDGRATGIAGLIGSVCTTGISRLTSRRIAGKWQGPRFRRIGAGPSGYRRT